MTPQLEAAIHLWCSLPPDLVAAKWIVAGIEQCKLFPPPGPVKRKR